MYGASEGLCTILIERQAPGGQAGTSSRIENYLGFPTGVAGDELAARALRQAKRFGAEILVARGATGIDMASRDATHAVLLEDGERVQTRSIVIATGVAWRELDLPNAPTLVGRGLYYGAARTEALNTRGLDIFMIGGGNSAGQAAMFFANYARTVTLIVRGPSLERSMSQYLIDQLASRPNIRVESRSQVVALEGTDRLAAIVIENRATGRRRREATEALFVFIGADAETAWLPQAVIRDGRDYLCTGRDVMDLVAGQQGSGRCRAIPTCSRPACPACSPSATCATARSSAWLPASARAAWRSPSCTNIWPIRRCSRTRPSTRRLAPRTPPCFRKRWIAAC